jgi:hypothetical protein
MREHTARPAFILPEAVWVLTVCALLFRLAFLFHHHATGYVVQHDAGLYQALAEGIRNGAFSMFHPLDIPETTRMPGYPWLIHVLGGTTVVLVVQVLVSTVKVPLLYLLGRSLGLPARLAMFPAACIALDPLDIVLAGNLLTEAWFTTLLLAGLLALVRSERGREVFVAACLFAAAAWIRPNGFLLAVLAAFLLIFRGPVHRLRAPAFLAIVLLLVMPWLFRNHALDGCIRLSDSGTVVAAHFHVPDVLEAAGEMDAGTYRHQLTRMAAATEWTDRESMRQYFDTVSDMNAKAFRDHPVLWLGIQLRKAGTLMLAPGRGHFFRHFGEQPQVRTALALLSAALALLSSITLFLLLFRWRRMDWPVLLLFATALLLLFTGALSAPDARFRVPAMPLLLVLAAWLVNSFAGSWPAWLTRWVAGTYGRSR